MTGVQTCALPISEEWQAGRRHRDAIKGPLGWPSTPQASPRLLVHAQCLDHFPSPSATFTQLFADSEAAFWLDSSLGDAQRARFSYMGDSSGPLGQLVTYRSRSRSIEIRQGPDLQTRSQSIFDFLAEQLRQKPQTGPPLPFDFTGGYVGYFGYELKGELEGEYANEASTPDAMWIKADRLIAFDHAEQQTWIVCIDQPALSEENRAWMEYIARQLGSPMPEIGRASCRERVL